MTSPNNSATRQDVLVIGCGFAGICSGIKLREKGITNFRIVEKSNGVGGTWWDNTYPGAACDVPSHLYCYSFEPNPKWTRVYSSQPEIQRYLEHCVDKYGLRSHIDHGFKVLEILLDETSGFWHVNFENGQSLIARHVINGSGGLHRPSWPDIEGRECFAGPSAHTARWDSSIDLVGQRVAVIGSAASAIQLIPAIAAAAASVTVYQRTPNYVVPRNDRFYTEREKRCFASFPWLARLLRWFIFLRMDFLLYPITRQGSLYGKYATRKVHEYIRKSVNDKKLAEALIPDYVIGCKRILVSDDIYQTLNRDDVEVVTDPISCIEQRGIRTARGTLKEADVLIFATGYDIEAHMVSIRVRGIGGREMADDWKDGAEAYNGSCVAGYPNYYLVTGPNTGVGTTSVVFMIEQEIDYILKLIDAAGADRLIEVKRSAQQDYNARISEELAGSVWASGCKSWYRRADGKITVLYPGSARGFRRQLKRVDFDDFNMTVLTRAGEIK